MISPLKFIRFISLTVLMAFVSISTSAQETGRWDPPWRVLLRAGVTDGWSQGTNEERRDLIMPEYIEVHKKWKEMDGVKMIGTIDDHLTQVGTPGSRDYGWYELYEIDKLSTVGEMLNLIRSSQLGKVSLYKYMRYDALIGTAQVEVEQVFGLLPGK
jgi:hypothetical protein